MDRRDLLKRTGIVTGSVALGAALPAAAPMSAQQAATLTVWDSLNDEIRGGIIDALATSFAAANGGIAVEHRGWTTEELTSTLPRSVEGNQGPDVSQVNNGESLTGPMIRGGQLVSLADYATEYGWNDRFAAGLLARNRYSADGTVFGEGDLWGISAESEIVGFYYNRQVFEDNGLAVPTTVAEFETLLGSLREAGQEPLVFGNLDKWQAIHLFGEVHGTMTNREFLDSLIYRRSGAASAVQGTPGAATPVASPIATPVSVGFDDQSIVDAAARLIAWNEAGYFMEGFEATGGDDATALFASGVGAVLLQGSWAAPQIAESLGENAGFFLMPPIEAGGSVLHVGGVGIPYSITTNAEDPALAAAFLDHLVSEEAFNLFIEAGSLPAGEIPADKIQANTVSGDLYTAWNAALVADAVGHYMDWAAPDFYDPLTGALQELLGGQVTAEQFAQTLQEFYAASFA